MEGVTQICTIRKDWVLIVINILKYPENFQKKKFKKIKMRFCPHVFPQKKHGKNLF